MKQQSGFTLIELIVVIVILGILAATALPKFSGITTDSRIALMKGVAAALEGASEMAHGQSLAEQLQSASSITTETGAVVTMLNYYPDSPGIALAIDTTGIVYGTNVAVGTPVTGTPAGFFPDAGRLACVVTYTEAAAPAAGVLSPPTISTAALNATNCV